MNSDAFPQDPALPQLAIAADAARMCEVWQQHLRSCAVRSGEVQECKITRLRYRRGNRCILQYQLQLAGPTDGQKLSHCFTGAIYAQSDRARRLYEKQLRSRPVSRRLPEAGAVAPFAFIADLKMFVQTFPYDRHLPALAHLVEGPPPDLQSALRERLGRGAWRIEQHTSEMIRYRAGLGATLRYDVVLRNAACGETRRQCFYLKAYPDERGAQTFQLLRQLREHVKGSSSRLGVVQPVAYSAPSRALLLEKTPGVSLDQILIHATDLAALQTAARALAALNQSRFVAARRHTREDEIANLKRASTRLQWACPHLRTDLERIVEAVVAAWVELPLAPVHRDLKTDHVFLDGDRMVLIDLDSFALAHPLLDAAQLLARLATLPHQLPVPPERARAAAAVFAEEYFALVPRDWRRQLAVHYAGAILDATQGFFGRQEPNWFQTVNALVRHACDSLDGKVW